MTKALLRSEVNGVVAELVTKGITQGYNFIACRYV